VAEEQSISAMSFETALAELEKIVSKLEGGEVALEKSISLYERGDALREHCSAKLKEAKLKVEKIVVGTDSRLTTEPAELE